MLSHWDKWMIKRFNKVSLLNKSFMRHVNRADWVFFSFFQALELTRFLHCTFWKLLYTCAHNQTKWRASGWLHKDETLLLAASLVELVFSRAASLDAVLWLPLPRFHESAAGQDVTHPSISPCTTDILRFRVGWRWPQMRRPWIKGAVRFKSQRKYLNLCVGFFFFFYFRRSEEPLRRKRRSKTLTFLMLKHEGWLVKVVVSDEVNHPVRMKPALAEHTVCVWECLV